MRNIVFGFAAVLMSSMPALAQTAGQNDHQDCRAQPQANDNAPAQDGQKTDTPLDTLSGRLEPCGGVLKPPPTGDRNAASPPPTGSNMPVIKPGQVPPQTGQ